MLTARMADGMAKKKLTETEIVANSMAEDDPNQNSVAGVTERRPRWGPLHAGAQELASQYTYGETSHYCTSMIVIMIMIISHYITAYLCTHIPAYYNISLAISLFIFPISLMRSHHIIDGILSHQYHIFREQPNTREKP